MTVKKKQQKKVKKPAIRIVRQEAPPPPEVKGPKSQFAQSMMRFCDDLDRGIDVILKL